ncbi:MAG: tRNA lysidine(34) synthetase TilS [Streptococcaceae bacterium]|jgi:tRNA(Ile)-lysidine synthase|nr:tRNA lysidine(34) synthetase TilS [Streptococcaceae bacterium]
MTGQDKFLKIVRAQGFFDSSKKIVIALSGGKDSMTLFQWLYNLRETLGVTLFCAHVNYGLRAPADSEEAQLRELMARLSVPFFVKKFTGKFTENSGRDFRYAFFKDVMAQTGATTLVTAHHKNDQAETFLMRATAGRRLRHLSGIAARQPFASGELVRPLLNFEKSELDATIFFEDATNAENEHFRNRVRNQILPALERENPRVVEALSRLSDEVGLYLSAVNEQIGELPDVMSLIDFRQLSPVWKNVTLQKYLEKFPDLQLSRAQFDEVVSILERTPQYRHPLTKTYQLTKTADSFFITSVSCSRPSFLEIVTENPNNSTFLEITLPSVDYQIRKRQEGDKITLHGSHRKLKQFFIDEKTPLEMRALPLIASKHEVLAIPALGVTSDLSKGAKNAKIKTIIWVKIRKE